MLKKFFVFCFLISVFYDNAQSLSKTDKILTGRHASLLATIVVKTQDFDSYKKNKIKILELKSKNQILNSLIQSLEYYKKKEMTKAYEEIYIIFHKGYNLTKVDSFMINSQLGAFYLDANDFLNSEKHLKRAQKVIYEENLPILNISSWLIELYLIKNKQNEAIKIVKANLKQKKVSPIFSYQNLALIYQEMGDFEMSDFYLNRADSLLKKNYTSEDNMFINLYFGNNCKSRNEIDKAISYYLKSLSDTIGMQNWYPYIQSNYALAELLIKKKEYEKCEYYLNKFFLCPCLEMETKAWLYEAKANFYKKTGNQILFVKNLEMALQLKDSVDVQKSENYAKIVELNNTHMQLVEENLGIKEKNELLAKQKNNIYLIVIILSVTLFITVGFIVVFRFKKKSEIFKINQELNETKIDSMKIQEENLKMQVQAKNIDLMQLANNITIKQEFEEEQKGMIKNLLKKKDEEIKLELRKVYNQLNSYENIDKHLETLQSDIENVNSEFHLKLKKRFPNLTKLDIELCSLHLLNLSTKEIATIRNVESKTIQMNRYRIKKKMNLTEDADLLTFLQDLMKE